MDLPHVFHADDLREADVDEEDAEVVVAAAAVGCFEYAASVPERLLAAAGGRRTNSNDLAEVWRESEVWNVQVKILQSLSQRSNFAQCMHQVS